ncbi:hypothetical protein [Spirosoma oryzicola]|uniref:hypothetical protein n=1 Tax=Spirosoma oryzicola TaxID=2898794 RepID=UPI001E5509D5|nr:hypothetical protein [Spirosoma oryzicola]UHG92533.1 hypothetical protein LQ777_06400 [Spirosoma oryzicola]
MVLTQEQQQRLSERIDAVADVGGVSRVAELAEITPRVIQKAQSGGNVKVETMESVMEALLAVEAERKAKLNKLQKALA